jgi:hypothetical protein
VCVCVCVFPVLPLQLTVINQTSNLVYVMPLKSTKVPYSFPTISTNNMADERTCAEMGSRLFELSLRKIQTCPFIMIWKEHVQVIHI